MSGGFCPRARARLPPGHDGFSAVVSSCQRRARRKGRRHTWPRPLWSERKLETPKGFALFQRLLQGVVPAAPAPQPTAARRPALGAAHRPRRALPPRRSVFRLLPRTQHRHGGLTRRRGPTSKTQTCARPLGRLSCLPPETVRPALQPRERGAVRPPCAVGKPPSSWGGRTGAGLGDPRSLRRSRHTRGRGEGHTAPRGRSCREPGSPTHRWALPGRPAPNSPTWDRKTVPAACSPEPARPVRSGGPDGRKRFSGEGQRPDRVGRARRSCTWDGPGDGSGGRRGAGDGRRPHRRR